MASNGKIHNIVEAGKQPDMVTFSPDGKYVLSANEGEPRNGYGEGTADPEGSITIIDMRSGVSKKCASQEKSKTLDFKKFDAVRNRLIQ